MEEEQIKPIHKNLTLDPTIVNYLYVTKGMSQPEIVNFFIQSQTEYITEVVNNILTVFNKEK